MRQVITSASGASAAVFALRDGVLTVTGSNWTGETATMECSADGVTWQPLTDAGGAVVLTANGVYRVAGGLHYRMNKASTRELKMQLTTPAA